MARAAGSRGTARSQRTDEVKRLSTCRRYSRCSTSRFERAPVPTRSRPAPMRYRASATATWRTIRESCRGALASSRSLDMWPNRASTAFDMSSSTHRAAKARSDFGSGGSTNTSRRRAHRRPASAAMRWARARAAARTSLVIAREGLRDPAFARAHPPRARGMRRGALHGRPRHRPKPPTPWRGS
jgi:hypothetical protein